MTDFQSLIFYLVVICISCFFASIAQRDRVYAYYKFGSTKNTPTYFVFMFFSMIPLIIMAGFRDGVGIDYGNYVSGYYRINNNDFIDNISTVEFGYIILVKLSKFIFNDPFGLFLFASIITILFLYFTLHRHRFHITITLTILLYYAKYYAFSLNGVRQAIAMSIILFGLKYISTRELKKFTFIILFASLFHTSALVMFPFYLIIGKQTNSKLHIKLLFLVISVFVVIYISEFLNFLSSIGIFSEYGVYVTSINENGFSVISLIVPITILAAILFFWKKLLKIEPMIELYFWIYLYGFVFSLVGIQLEFVGRISLYFDIVSIILIPLIINVFKSKPIRFIAYGLVVLYCLVVFLLGNYISDGHDIIPYKFIWE